jgi:hypothetical protein
LAQFDRRGEGLDPVQPHGQHLPTPGLHPSHRLVEYGALTAAGRADCEDQPALSVTEETRELIRLRPRNDRPQQFTLDAGPPATERRGGQLHQTGVTHAPSRLQSVLLKAILDRSSIKLDADTLENEVSQGGRHRRRRGTIEHETGDDLVPVADLPFVRAMYPGAAQCPPSHIGRPVDVGEFVELGADAFAVEYPAVVRGDIGAATGAIREIIYDGRGRRRAA